jgi:hypothetical protein
MQQKIFAAESEAERMLLPGANLEKQAKIYRCG